MVHSYKKRTKRTKNRRNKHKRTRRKYSRNKKIRNKYSKRKMRGGAKSDYLPQTRKIFKDVGKSNYRRRQIIDPKELLAGPSKFSGPREAKDENRLKSSTKRAAAKRFNQFMGNELRGMAKE